MERLCSYCPYRGYFVHLLGKRLFRKGLSIQESQQEVNPSCLSSLLNNQGPVVQSVVSLTSSLRVISLTGLVDSIYNILIFFAEKCEKLLTFFQQKISAYLRITRCKF